VLAHQLERLCTIIEDKADHVRIHVMPYHAGAHPVIGGSLKILSFASPWLPDMVWQEAVTTGNLIEKPQVVGELIASFAEAVDRALDREASLEAMRQVRKEMET
jgi:hypothetical protein